MTMVLKKIDISSIDLKIRGNVLVIIGRRETGKSCLVRDILTHHKDVPITSVVVSGGRDFYSKFIHENIIHDEFKTDIISNVFAQQKKNQKNQIVVLDNCFYDDSWKQQIVMRDLFTNGPIWKISVIMTMTYPLQFLPGAHIDYVFILREPAINIRKRIFQNYAAHLNLDFKQFSSLMDNFTEEHECLVIKHDFTSTELEGNVFWYRAQKNTG
jgi:nicotinamide riboside kinase